MGSGWGSRAEPHPLIDGKTPLELEEMTLPEIRTHLERARAYAAKVAEEETIHHILDLGSRQPETLMSFPSYAVREYQHCWKIARKRVGLDE